jgi:CRISPR type I-E-associated protein CasB/Cse2
MSNPPDLLSRAKSLLAWQHHQRGWLAALRRVASPAELEDLPSYHRFLGNIPPTEDTRNLVYCLAHLRGEGNPGLAKALRDSAIHPRRIQILCTANQDKSLYLLRQALGQLERGCDLESLISYLCPWDKASRARLMRHYFLAGAKGEPTDLEIYKRLADKRSANHGRLTAEAAALARVREPEDLKFLPIFYELTGARADDRGVSRAVYLLPHIRHADQGPNLGLALARAQVREVKIVQMSRLHWPADLVLLRRILIAHGPLTLDWTRLVKTLTFWYPHETDYAQANKQRTVEMFFQNATRKNKGA